MIREQMEALEGEFSALKNEHSQITEELSALKVKQSLYHYSISALQVNGGGGDVQQFENSNWTKINLKLIIQYFHSKIHFQI